MALTNTFTILVVTLIVLNIDVLATNKNHFYYSQYYKTLHKHQNHTEPEPEPSCKQDNGEAAGLIREAILAANFMHISEIFQIYCGEEASLARGFDFDDSVELLEPTSDRLNDPDIVSFKGLAYHSMQTKEYERLANIFLYALYGNDLITLEMDYKCTCKEKVVSQKSEPYLDDMDYGIVSKYGSNMTSADNTSSKWYIDAKAITTSLDYSDSDSIGCQWSATIKIECKDESKEKPRKLTEAELAEKRSDLIADFSNESYMQSIVDNSYFDDLTTTYYHTHGKRKLAMTRELLLANARSVVSSICNVCDPEDTCCREASHCSQSQRFCPS